MPTSLGHPRATVGYVWRAITAQLFRGFCMGAADLIPGVSGGTVALLLGIYDRLIEQIKSLSGAISRLGRADFAGFRQRIRYVDWYFLISLLAGILLAVALLVSWLRAQIEEHPVVVSALFFGLVAASALVARREIVEWRPTRFIIFAATATLTFAAVGLRSGGIENPTAIVVLVAGALAICAMVLPGISGSFVLVIIGLYDHLIGVIERTEFGVLGLYALGAVTGLCLFSHFLHWLLTGYRDYVIAVLLGLMAGSLRVLWPWPVTDGGIEDTRLEIPPLNEAYGALLAALLGAVGLLALVQIATRFENFDAQDTLERSP